LPTISSTTRHPLPSTGSPRPGFPCFHGTMKCSDSLAPSRRTSFWFAWRYHDERRCFAPAGPERVTGGPGVEDPVPGRTDTVEGAGRPKFLENPDVLMPCSSTPAGPDAPGHDGAPTRPPSCQNRRLAAGSNLEAQSHGFGTGCLRFVVWVTPPLHARLASGCRPGSTGWDWLPTGFLREVLKLYDYILASSPKLCLAQ
jgi:hypothetical protein